MINKDKRRYYTASVHFSAETMRQLDELSEDFGESRSRVISRSVELMYRSQQEERPKESD
jgi:predicted transcriptional regulator